MVRRTSAKHKVEQVRQAERSVFLQVANGRRPIGNEENSLQFRSGRAAVQHSVKDERTDARFLMKHQLSSRLVAGGGPEDDGAPHKRNRSSVSLGESFERFAEAPLSSPHLKGLRFATCGTHR